MFIELCVCTPDAVFYIVLVQCSCVDGIAFFCCSPITDVKISADGSVLYSTSTGTVKGSTFSTYYILGLLYYRSTVDVLYCEVQ